MIEGRVALTEQDFSAAWRFLPQTRSSVAVSVWLVLFIPALVCLAMLQHANSVRVYLASVLITSGALVFGLRRGRTRWARWALDFLRGAEGVLFRFDEHGFLLKSPGRESQLAWDTLHRCIETSEAFLIYTAPQVVAVVPKRAFTPSQQAELQTLLRERIRPQPLTGGFRLGRALLLWLLLVIAFLGIWQFFSPR